MFKKVIIHHKDRYFSDIAKKMSKQKKNLS